MCLFVCETGKTTHINTRDREAVIVDFSDCIEPSVWLYRLISLDKITELVVVNKFAGRTIDVAFNKCYVISWRFQGKLPSLLVHYPDNGGSIVMQTSHL